MAFFARLRWLSAFDPGVLVAIEAGSLLIDGRPAIMLGILTCIQIEIVSAVFFF